MFLYFVMHDFSLRFSYEILEGPVWPHREAWKDRDVYCSEWFSEYSDSFVVYNDSRYTRLDLSKAKDLYRLWQVDRKGKWSLNRDRCIEDTEFSIYDLSKNLPYGRQSVTIGKTVVDGEAAYLVSHPKWPAYILIFYENTLTIYKAPYATRTIRDTKNDIYDLFTAPMFLADLVSLNFASLKTMIWYQGKKIYTGYFHNHDMRIIPVANRTKVYVLPKDQCILPSSNRYKSWEGQYLEFIEYIKSKNLISESDYLHAASNDSIAAQTKNMVHKWYFYVCEDKITKAR